MINKSPQGLTYLNKVVDANNPPASVETRDSLTFSGPVDSVYKNAGASHCAPIFFSY